MASACCSGACEPAKEPNCQLSSARPPLSNVPATLHMISSKAAVRSSTSFSHTARPRYETAGLAGSQGICPKHPAFTVVTPSEEVNLCSFTLSILHQGGSLSVVSHFFRVPSLHAVHQVINQSYSTSQTVQKYNGNPNNHCSGCLNFAESILLHISPMGMLT